MRIATLSIAAAALAVAGAAVAAPSGPGRMMPQGDVTRAQAEARAAEHFAKMDVNSDGVLNAADREARQAQMFARLDTDKNGSISQAEFAAHHRGPPAGGAGKRAGAHDGANGEHAAMAGHRMGGGKMGGMKRMGGHRMGGMMGRMADTNKDGTVTRAEFTAAALARFDRIDGDRNGTVTATERKTAHQAMRTKMQERRAARQPG